MTRGEVVIASTGSGFGKKPRPMLVIQADGYAELTTTVLALISSNEEAARISLNVEISPTFENGLRRRSWVMVHSLATARLEEIDKRIGAFDAPTMQRVDYALLSFLGLIRP